jgi:AAA ATPase domain
MRYGLARSPDLETPMSWQLTELLFENYRTFQREERIAIRPLTLLIGRNSSGKSAIARLPIILRRALSLESQAPLEFDFDGHDFGSSFVDVVYNGVATRAITLGMTVSDGEQSITLRVSVGYWEEFRLQAVRSIQLQVGQETLLDLNWVLEGDPNDDGLDYLDWTDRAASPQKVKARFTGILPTTITGWDPGRMAKLQPFYSALRAALANLVYLGPFRDAPDRMMRLPESSVRDVGPRGALAARALASDMLRRGSPVLRRVGDWYKKQLGGWELDLVREGQMFWVVLHPPGDATVTVNIRDAGVGLSQVLPVVVQHELDRQSARSGGLDIVEQPELHLHPGAHGALADLYIEAVNRGASRVIIETHAENLILRVRRRIAESQIPSEPPGAPDEPQAAAPRLSVDDAALYWVDHALDATPRVRPITIYSNGNVDHWPTGVFAEDFEEARAIRRAQQGAVP